jgi:NAD(P)-dependent dehydrogenase (short-subunit alcohol dehydrogenase family)
MSDTGGGRYSNPFRAIFAGIGDLLHKRQNVLVLEDSDRLDGKSVLITGASSGLGFAASVQLACRGAKVIMACRSGIPEKGEMVRRLSGSRHISMLEVDLADMQSIRKLVSELVDAEIKLDVLICNAAIVPAQSRKSPQGIEEMFAVNFLAKYLLVRLLLENEVLDTAGDTIPRIIFVSSESHRNPERFDWDNFGRYRDYGIGKTVELYGYYKLLLTTFANELARRVNSGGTVQYSIFALCPGPVNSNLAREAPLFIKPILKLVFAFFFRSPQKAVEPIVYLACSHQVEGRAIDYLFLMTRKEMDPKAVHPENGKKLWRLTEGLLDDIGVTLKLR